MKNFIANLIHKRFMPLLMAISILLAFPIALAEAAAQPVTTLEEFLHRILWPTVFTVATALVSWLGAVAVQLVKSLTARVKNDTIASVLEQLGVITTTAVASVMQEAVLDLKAAHEDGKLSPDEAKAALHLAVNRIWGALGAEAKDALAGLFGGDASAAITQLVEPAVEAEVAMLSSMLPAAAPLEGEGAKLDAIRHARTRLGLQ